MKKQLKQDGRVGKGRVLIKTLQVNFLELKKANLCVFKKPLNAGKINKSRPTRTNHCKISDC